MNTQTNDSSIRRELLTLAGACDGNVSIDTCNGRVRLSFRPSSSGAAKSSAVPPTKRSALSTPAPVQSTNSRRCQQRIAELRGIFMETVKAYVDVEGAPAQAIGRAKTFVAELVQTSSDLTPRDCAACLAAIDTFRVSAPSVPTTTSAPTKPQQAKPARTRRVEDGHLSFAVPGNASKLVDRLRQRKMDASGLDEFTAQNKAVGQVLYLIEHAKDPALTDELRAQATAETRQLFPKKLAAKASNAKASNAKASVSNGPRLNPNYWTTPVSHQDRIKMVSGAQLSPEEQVRRAAERKQLRIARAKASSEASRSLSGPLKNAGSGKQHQPETSAKPGKKNKQSKDRS